MFSHSTVDKEEIRIEVSGLTKRFVRRGGGHVTPIDNTSFSVAADEMLVLLGPSGCGKTTLLRCIAGLERPDSGEIVINGTRVFSSKHDIFVPPNKRPISMVFQTYALWPHMTVYENVAYPLRSRGVKDGSVNERVLEVLRLVDLEGLAHQYPGQISGGQQQRVALARAVAPHTGVMLFDEPLSNVDAKVREQVRAEIAHLQNMLEFTGLYVTHDQIEAMALADRIALINSGRIEQIGTPEEIYERPSSVYVGNFVGAANLWKARVVSVGSHEAVVSTDLGLLKILVPWEKHGCWQSIRSEKHVKVLVRPEVVEVTNQEPAVSDNSFRGRLEKRTFLGMNVEFTVKIGDETIKASASRSNVHMSDPDIWIHVKPSNLVLLNA